MTIIRSLPQGWVWAFFGDVAIIESNLVDPAAYQDSPHIAPNHIESWTGKLLEYTTIAEDKVFSPKHVFRPGQILYSKIRPYLAKAVLVDFSGLCSADMYPIAAHINPAYLHRWLISPEFTELASRNQGRTVLPKINQPALQKLTIPVPPLNEQRRIVSKIEALKARSQRVKEELEAIPALLDQFRQSVLAAAFRGDLTADWRKKNPDVEPASVLLERIRAERRRRWEEAELEKMKAQGKTPKDDKWKEKYEEPESTFPTDLPQLPQGWVYSRLDFIADVIDPNPKHRNPKYVQDGFSFITTAEFIEPDGINIHTNRSVAEETVIEQENRCQFTEKSIVFSRKGTIGKTRILPTDIRFALLDSLCVINPMSGIDHNYLNLVFHSSIVCKQIESSTRGVALKQVSVGRVRSLLIPIPSLLEQITLFETVKNSLKKAWNINNSINDGFRELESLSQSILAKAFRGELVPQDPNDEPASVLLERIRAEREKLDTKKKAKGKSEKKSRKAKPEAAELEQLNLPGFE